MMFSKSTLRSYLLLGLAFGVTTPMYAHAEFFSSDENNGHLLVQDVEKSGTRVEFEEDQDEVFRAVEQGKVRPFSELYATVENDFYGRVIKVELEEEDEEWVYELKLLHNDRVIRVDYDAESLDILQIKGRSLRDAFKPTIKEQ